CASTKGTTAKSTINARTFICRIDILLRDNAASMPLQEAMHFFSQLGTNPFRGRNFVHRRFAQTIHGTKLPKQQILSVLTHTWAIVKNAFADALFHEQLMISVGETMCFIANALEQTQSTGIHWQLKRQRPGRSINLLVFLGEPDNRQIMQSKPLQFAACRGELAFSP